MAKRLLPAISVVLGVALVWRLQAPGGECSSMALQSNPSREATTLIQGLGGLPKVSGELTLLTDFPGAVYPESNWQVVRVVLENPFPTWQSIIDDDPNFGVQVDIQVDYRDGDKGLLRWETWRYGLLICPYLVSYGDGPPGRVEVISLASG